MSSEESKEAKKSLRQCSASQLVKPTSPKLVSKLKSAARCSLKRKLRSLHKKSLYLLKKPKMQKMRKSPSMIRPQRRKQLLELCIKAKTSRKTKRRRKTRRKRKSFCCD